VLARRDPCWAILSSSHWDLVDFRATGVPEAARPATRFVEVTGRQPSRSTVADFGCGVGRLSVPLLDHFESVHGYDISATMLEGATEYARDSGVDLTRLRLHLVEAGGAPYCGRETNSCPRLPPEAAGTRTTAAMSAA
jgi:SAM-dependent methyltransferase